MCIRDRDTEKYIGSDEIWEESENAIREACKEKGLETREEVGEAAFYEMCIRDRYNIMYAYIII